MSNIKYVKNYKKKELRQYVLAYLLITIASVGFQTVAAFQSQDSWSEANAMALVFQMIMTDVFIGAICVLVIIFNEIWSDKMKTNLVYGQLPSDTVFSRISNGKIDATGFDLDKARVIYAHLFSASAAKQTAEWNKLLRKCRDFDYSNVVEAERMQLMTRDICISTVSLFIMNIVAVLIITIINRSICISLEIFIVPIVYLVIMFFITKKASCNRANRFLSLVIKNNIQDNKDDQVKNEGELKLL
jgi:uncharacterized protein YacL